MLRCPVVAQGDQLLFQHRGMAGQVQVAARVVIVVGKPEDQQLVMVPAEVVVDSPAAVAVAGSLVLPQAVMAAMARSDSVEMVAVHHSSVAERPAV
jgi:hypothetical protein